MQKLFRVLSFLSFIACAFSSCDPVFALTKTPAKDISANVADFDGNLSENDTDVQKALQTLNDMPVVGSENDPVFLASEAHSINSTDTTNWDTAYGWGDHAGLYLPINGEAASVNGLTITPGASISGNNTGDQSANDFDISDLADSGNLIATWNAKVSEAPSDGNQYVRKNAGWETVTIPAGTDKRGPSATFNGCGLPLVAGTKSLPVRVPYSGTITGWTILSDVSGSCVIDVWKDTYANRPPTVADTIAGSEKPTLSSASGNQDVSLSTWTTSVTEGDLIIFNVDSAATVTEVFVQLHVTATS